MNTHEALALIAMAVSVLSGVITLLVKSNATLRDRETVLRDRELDRRLSALEVQDRHCAATLDQHAERLRVDEIATERLATRATVLEHKIEDLDDLVTRKEFEQGMAHVTRQLDQILTRMGSGRSGQYGAQQLPKPER